MTRSTARRSARPGVVRDLAFEEWRRQADAVCWQRVGCGLDDLPDMPLRDWYDEGVRPGSAAVRAIRNAREEGGF